MTIATHLEHLERGLAALSSRYSLRFHNGTAPGWQILRHGRHVVGDYTLACYGPIAGELALGRLRQLQTLEREMALCPTR